MAMSTNIFQKTNKQNVLLFYPATVMAIPGSLNDQRKKYKISGNLCAGCCLIFAGILVKGKRNGY